MIRSPSQPMCLCRGRKESRFRRAVGTVGPSVHPKAPVVTSAEQFSRWNPYKLSNYLFFIDSTVLLSIFFNYVSLFLENRKNRSWNQTYILEGFSFYWNRWNWITSFSKKRLGGPILMIKLSKAPSWGLSWAPRYIRKKGSHCCRLEEVTLASNTLRLHGMSRGVKTTSFKAPGVSLGVWCFHRRGQNS